MSRETTMSKFRAWLARKIYKSSVTIYTLHPLDVLDVHIDGTELRLEGRPEPMNERKGKSNE